MKSLYSTLSCFAAAVLVALTGAGCTAKMKQAQFIRSGENYFAAGKYDEAKLEYMNLLRLDPQNAVAIERLGAMWFEGGAPLRAFAFLLKTREQAPGNLASRARLASCYRSVGQFAKAREEAIAILQQSPANAEALLLLAELARKTDEIEEAEQWVEKFPALEGVTPVLASATLLYRRGDLAAAEKAAQRALALDPKSPAAHLAWGEFHSLRKDYPQANEELKTAAELSAIRSPARLKYAEFRITTEAPNEAMTLLREITRQAPDCLPAWSLLAKIALTEKKFDEALGLVKNVFSRDMDNLDARMLQFQVWLETGEVQKAVAGLEGIDKTYPSIPALKYQLAKAYLRSNQSARAAASLKQAVAIDPDYSDAILLLAELNLRMDDPAAVVPAMVGLLRKQPKLVRAQLFLTDAYRALGRWDEAAAILRQQSEASPRNPQPHFQLGLVLRKQNKPGEAQAAFEKAQTLAPVNLLPTYQLVELHLLSKDYSAAMLSVQRMIETNPSSSDAHFLKGKIHAAQDQWKPAEAALLKALELDPNSAAAYDLLISTYIADNQLSEAIARLEATLRKNPGNMRAQMTSALIYERTGDVSKARDAYEKVIATHPDFLQALNNLAFLYGDRLDQPDRAYELAKQARALQPNDSAVADTLGWILFKRGDYQQALSVLTESVGKSPENPEVQYHQGMAAYMAGNPHLARTALQRAAEASGDFPGKEEIHRRLTLLGDGSGNSKELSIDELEALLQKWPDDVLARLKVGESYEKRASYEKAALAFERALKTNPNLLSPTVKLATLNAGPLQKPDKALEYSRKARELARNEPKEAGSLGRQAHGAGQITLAYTLLRASADQLTKDGGVFRDLAWAAYRLGRTSEARESMQRVLVVAPGSDHAKEATSFLAMTALDQDAKGLAAAGPAIETALQSNPGFLPAQMAQGALQGKNGDTNGAAGTYSEVLRRYPDFPLAQKRLAAIYLNDQKKRPLAYELAASVHKSLPDDAEATQILAEILFYRKEYPMACQLLQESAGARPLDANSLYLLGMGQYHQDDKVRSRSTLARALQAGLEAPQSDEARRVLDEWNLTR